ncbi:MAG: hypothetical protein HKN01_01590 [Acidimicrobiia bacterium]|nr:hypothetical protein [Acidimicrobiia bacterium]
MPYRARKSFMTGRTLVQEGSLYDTDFDLPDRFDEVSTPDGDKQPVKSPRKGAATKAAKAEPAPEDDE